MEHRSHGRNRITCRTRHFGCELLCDHSEWSTNRKLSEHPLVGNPQLAKYRHFIHGPDFGCGSQEGTSKNFRQSLEIRASTNRPPRELQFHDCPLRRQSHENPIGLPGDGNSDHFQPQNRQGFAFELLRKPHRLATTTRLARSRGEFLKLLIPCSLRTRRLLQVSELY